MTIVGQTCVPPSVALREIVLEATAALVQMDTERLEDLARCCIDLNREVGDTRREAESARELQAASPELALLGQVLYETRANLAVLTRLHTLRLQDAQCWDDTDLRRKGGGFFSSFEDSERASEYGDN